MEQTWATGTVIGSPAEIEILGPLGEHCTVPIARAVELGVPTAAKVQRHPFEGNFATWELGSTEAYLAGVGLVLPVGVQNRHAVYRIPLSDKLTAHVPALVLIRAFFKPHDCVLPAVFHPASLELLSFVDYGQTPPVVVLDETPLGHLAFRSKNSVSRKRAVQWCQLSVSARAMSWSVFRNALQGHLGFSLPKGRARIVLHGVREAGNLFVTRAALSFVEVPAQDSLTGRDERYVFHAGADGGRKRYASIEGLSVPPRPDGEYSVCDEEWEQLDCEMQRAIGTRRYPHREVLDLILHKISSGVPWENLSPDRKLVQAVKMAFRTWSADGRMGIALEVLSAARYVGE